MRRACCRPRRWLRRRRLAARAVESGGACLGTRDLISHCISIRSLLKHWQSRRAVLSSQPRRAAPAKAWQRRARAAGLAAR